MKRADDILKNEIYIKELKNIKSAERDRKFCRHGLEHFLDTARIAYILCLENGIDIKKDVIYATALLHDIGRYRQYRDCVPHNIIGCEIAKELLGDFNEDEKKLILDAISEHRTSEGGNVFADIFSRADKLSRTCFNCDAYEECNWSDEKKNNSLKY